MHKAMRIFANKNTMMLLLWQIFMKAYMQHVSNCSYLLGQEYYMDAAVFAFQKLNEGSKTL